MGKTFYYGKIKKSYYIEKYDTYENDVEEIEYEVDDATLSEVIVDFIFLDYFENKKFEKDIYYYSTVKKGIENFIDENNLLSEMVEQYEDRLKEYFEQEALDN